MVHPFLIDQRAYLNRVASSSVSLSSSSPSSSSTNTSSRTTDSRSPIQTRPCEIFTQTTASSTHIFGRVSPRSSRLSFDSQNSNDTDEEMKAEKKRLEKEIKRERRKGVIGRLF